MTYDEMLQDAIDKLKNVDKADLATIHEYLVWNEQQRHAWTPPKAKSTLTEILAEEQRSEALLDQDALGKDKGE